MKKIDLGCLGIVITVIGDDTYDSTIESTMKVASADEFNRHIDTLELAILAHFRAGIDVTSPTYKEGIEVTFSGIKPKAEIKTIRELFDSADSISIDDEFYRYFSPSISGEYDVILNFEDDCYEFTPKSIDDAVFDDGTWSVFCSNSDSYVGIVFYSVTEIR